MIISRGLTREQAAAILNGMWWRSARGTEQALDWAHDHPERWTGSDEEVIRVQYCPAIRKFRVRYNPQNHTIILEGDPDALRAG